jgi:hypothetical protein
VTGGNSKVVVAKAFRTALKHHDIRLAATGKASYRHHSLKFPVTGGKANPPKYALRYAGGIKLVRGNATLRVTKLQIALGSTDVTGVVNGHKRINLFVDGLPAGGNGGPGDVSFGDYTVTLAHAAVKAFDNHLSTKTFAHHTAVGTGFTTVKFKV